MFGHTYYHSLTKKYISIFGTLFNDIYINRPHSNNQNQSIKVNLTYSGQDKMITRLNSDPLLDRKAAAISPTMSFEYKAPVYDAERKLQNGLRRCNNTETGKVVQFLPVPYNIDFTLYITAKEEEDGLRVLEQILPHFNPTVYVTANLIPELDYRTEIPITLNNIEYDNRSYEEVETRRQIIWTLNFTMRAEFSGEISSPSNLIKVVHVNFRNPSTNTIIEEVHVQPGLTANGQPTNSANNSISPLLINPNDDYGYIVEILEGPEPHP